MVGLGRIEASIVQPVLGGAIEYIEDPSATDLASADGALVRAAYVVDRACIDAMPQLKVIARTGVGTEMVDVAYARSRGIPVVITPGTNSVAVAEGVMAQLLHLSKRLGPLTREIRAGRWPASNAYPLGDLSGSTLGIVGYGRIGRIVAQYAAALGMQTLAYDPHADVPRELRVDSLQELASRSDALTLHVPLTDETRNLINLDLLRQCRRGVIIINCGRGGLVDLDAADAALRDGSVGGLGLDVYEQEPPQRHAVFDHENVVLTPHVMGLSKQATVATYQAAAEGVRAVLEGRTPSAVAD